MNYTIFFMTNLQDSERSNMKVQSSFRTIILLIIAIIVIFSCSNEGNQREKTLKAIGNPDNIIQEEFGTYKSELWIYARSDINRVYRFEKSSSSCGGSNKWYLSPYLYYADYHFGYELYNPPPTITHTPIESAVAGKAITINAKVELHKPVKNVKPDKEIKEVNLQYRVTGDSLFTQVRMSIEDSLFTEEIPDEIVTVAGVDYFIEAISDESSWGKYSQLPKKDFYSIVVSADSSAHLEKADYTDSTIEEFKSFSLPEPGGLPGRFTPISP